MASTTPKMRRCGGPNVFCPAGTKLPQLVHSGFYTADPELIPCPPGAWRNFTSVRDPTVPANTPTQEHVVRSATETAATALAKLPLPD